MSLLTFPEMINIMNTRLFLHIFKKAQIIIICWSVPEILSHELKLLGPHCHCNFLVFVVINFLNSILRVKFKFRCNFNLVQQLQYHALPSTLPFPVSTQILIIVIMPNQFIYLIVVVSFHFQLTTCQITPYSTPLRCVTAIREPPIVALP